VLHIRRLLQQHGADVPEAHGLLESRYAVTDVPEGTTNNPSATTPSGDDLTKGVIAYAKFHRPLRQIHARTSPGSPNHRDVA
jgi:hypothetical protein